MRGQDRPANMGSRGNSRVTGGATTTPEVHTSHLVHYHPLTPHTARYSTNQIEVEKMPSKEIFDEIQRVYSHTQDYTGKRVEEDEGHYEGGIHVPPKCTLIDGKVYLGDHHKFGRK